MRLADWLVLCTTLAFIVSYGLWRGRGSNSVNKYLLAGKTMPWYAMAFSIMATQASAITFISTTGQSYVDGLRFVQFYLGLPLAMIVVSAVLVPMFHRARVYTAYEFLEQRFDAKTRALVSVIFLIQRGLAIGIALSAPAIVLTVIFGWRDTYTIAIMGGLAVLYTASGGVKAVTWTEFPQMIIMTCGLIAAMATALFLFPHGMGLADAFTIAGAAGRLNAVVTSFSWSDRYNIWSGVCGGMFVALAYFGCDQSQVQRYLTGKSIAESRVSLMFNGVAKIPMQLFILSIGAVIFSFYHFEKPPVLFKQTTLDAVRADRAFPQVEARYDAAFEQRKAAAARLVAATNGAGDEARRSAKADYRRSQDAFQAARGDAMELAKKAEGGSYNDTNYIFLTFVTTYLPAGAVGLIIAMILGAAMSSISSEINSLATVSVIDLYCRHWNRSATDRHYVAAAKAATVFWGAYAVVTAGFGKNLGSLIEAVNILGSLFYGGLLGVFVLVFFKRVDGNGAFYGVIAGELAIFAAARFTSISFLWYNVIGCAVVVAVGLAVSVLAPRRVPGPPLAARP
jgi:Na+/proline symporter